MPKKNVNEFKWISQSFIFELFQSVRESFAQLVFYLHAFSTMARTHIYYVYCV